MQKKIAFFQLAIFFCCCANAQNTPENLKLWDNRPASIWEEALPLGNARTGAMVFGDFPTQKGKLYTIVPK